MKWRNARPPIVGVMSLSAAIMFALIYLSCAPTTKEFAMNETHNDVLAAVNRFNEAFNRHDVDAVMRAMTDDCVFENTNPPPDGVRYVGQREVRKVWEKFFAANPDAHFDVEEMFYAGDRCVVRWVYRKTKEGKPWHLRGVDIFTIRDGKIAQKLSYVKG